MYSYIECHQRDPRTRDRWVGQLTYCGFDTYDIILLGKGDEVTCPGCIAERGKYEDE